MAFSRDRFWDLLKAQPRPALPALSVAEELHDGYVVEKLRFDVGDGEVARGVLTRPSGAGPHPGLLYMHAHGNRYDVGVNESLAGQTYMGSPLGPVFARAGYVTLMLEMPTFGTRDAMTESALVKALLWHGKTLMGQMLSELTGAVGYLAARADVDAGRLGAFGMSMGCTHAFMLAALDARLKAVAQLCCFADYATLIELGLHDIHGNYLTIPGMLRETSVGGICGAIAPRAQLICVGADDPLTPPLALGKARAETEAAYAAAGRPDLLEIFVQPGTPHQETPEIREKVLGFFARTL